MRIYRSNKRMQDKRFFQRQSEKSRYGVTKEDFDYQCCLLCQSANNLVIDHCHDSGIVRGLLCNSCNLALGQLGDSIEALETVIKYLNGDFGRIKRKEYP